MRDPALDPVELPERHLGVLHVLDRGGILSHLLHQAFGGGDGIPDLVRDGGGEFVDARLLLRLHGRALAAELPLDRRVEEALPKQTGAEDRHVVGEESYAPPECGPEEPGVAGAR